MQGLGLHIFTQRKPTHSSENLQSEFSVHVICWFDGRTIVGFVEPEADGSPNFTERAEPSQGSKANKAAKTANLNIQ